MRTDRFFAEKQRFNLWIFIILLFATTIILITGTILQVFFDRPFGNNPMENTELIILTIVIILVGLMILSIRLDTYIDKNGIKVKMFPFHRKWKQFQWDQISKAEVRKYKPIAEYGGWGLRGYGKNKAYNVSGNMGLQLELKNGTKLLIGTDRHKELDVFIKKITTPKIHSGDIDGDLTDY